MDVERIRMAVNACDPIDLLTHAPPDEYEDKIRAIAQELGAHGPELDGEVRSRLVIGVFAEAFDAEMVDEGACRLIARLPAQ